MKKLFLTILFTLFFTLAGFPQTGAVTKVTAHPTATPAISIDSKGSTTFIGDVTNANNQTQIQLDDLGKTILLSGSASAGQIDLTSARINANGGFVTPTRNITDNGTTVATNGFLSDSFRVTALTASVTLSNPTNPANGQRIVWEVIQNASAAKTLAFDTQFGFGAEITACTISATLSSHNFITAVYNSTTTKWYVVGCVTGY